VTSWRAVIFLCKTSLAALLVAKFIFGVGNLANPVEQETVWAIHFPPLPPVGVMRMEKL
jgi:hypothetical protein